MEKIPRPHQILFKSFNRKKLKNPSYSQRALARDLSISPVFVTKILNGEKEIPPKRIKKFVKVLDMDVTAENLLYQSILFHTIPIPEVQNLLLHGFKISKLNIYEQNVEKKFSLLKNWYGLAILDLLTCQVNHDPKNMAKALGITVSEVEQTLAGLLDVGLIEQHGTQFIKSAQHSFFPTTKSRKDVRDFHKQMLKKAYEALSNTSQEEYERRLVTGFTIATNPEKLEEAKRIIFDSLSEIALLLSEGTCKEVYQYNVQLFPLTKHQK